MSVIMSLQPPFLFKICQSALTFQNVRIPSFQHVTECTLHRHCTLTSFLPCLLFFFPFVHRAQLYLHSLTSVCAHRTWIEQAFCLNRVFRENDIHTWLRTRHLNIYTQCQIHKNVLDILKSQSSLTFLNISLTFFGTGILLALTLLERREKLPLPFLLSPPPPSSHFCQFGPQACTTNMLLTFSKVNAD